MLNAKTSTVKAEHALPRLLKLSCQASVQGNYGLASKLLSQAKHSAATSDDIAAHQCLAYQEACQLHKQPGEESEAMTKLSSLTRSSMSIPGNVKAQEGEVRAVACIELASWAQSQGDTAQNLEGLESTEVGNYAQLWQVCGRREQVQLQLLFVATQLGPSMALSWAAMSNWLHSKLSDDLLKVLLKIHCKSRKIKSALLDFANLLDGPWTVLQEALSFSI